MFPILFDIYFPYFLTFVESLTMLPEMIPLWTSKKQNINKGHTGQEVQLYFVFLEQESLYNNTKKLLNEV